MQPRKPGASVVKKTPVGLAAFNRMMKRRMKRKVRNLKLVTSNPLLRGKSYATGMKRPAVIKTTKKLSPAGLNFLKCAFAPPDFTSTQVQGVPDMFRGNSLLKKHRYTGTFTFAANTDYYFVLAPVPAVAFFVGTTAANIPVSATAAFAANNYSDFSSLFSTFTTVTTIVPQFRFISNHFEIISTTNDLSWSGLITAYKIPLRMSSRGSVAFNLNDLYALNGLNGINTNSANMYTGPFKAGAFVAAYNADSTFPFSPTFNEIGALPQLLDAGDFGQLQGSGIIPGFDNSFETVIVKVSGITAPQTAVLKAWSCVEYKPSPNSDVYEYSTVSPPEDVTALEIYREVALALPVGVPSAMNAGLWERVLRIIRNLSAYGSLLPGPIGTVSTGVNLISGGLSELTL